MTLIVNRKKSGHTRASPPLISLDQPGRLRVANILAIFNFSHSTLYARLRMKRFPPPDGRDGAMPYWHTSTVKTFLET